MITERKQHQLFGYSIFEKVTVKGPFKIPNPVPNEACFLILLEGQIDYKIQDHSISIPEKEAVLLKCGTYFSQMKSNPLSENNQIVFVHFHPEILKKIYESDLPKIFQQPTAIEQAVDITQINTDFLIQKYIESLLFYFDNPALINEDLLVLKLKEIILLLA